MSTLRTLFGRIRATLAPGSRDEELSEEIRAHLELLAHDYERGGMAPEQARLAARRAFGGVEQMKERYRDRRALPWLEDARRDLQHSLRALRRAPVFAVSAVLTLALGMSAMTGMLTIMNAFMFRPLPVNQPEQLVSISTREDAVGIPQGLSFPDLQDYRTQSGVLTDAIGYVPRPAALDAGNGGERIGIEIVTGNYFSMLGVQPGAGRLIQPTEGLVRGDAPVIVLTHKYWQARFSGDPSVVGRAVRLNGRPFTIVGVTPRSFDGTEPLFRIDAYVPLSMFDDLLERSSSIYDDRVSRALYVLGRVKPGSSLAQVRAALDNRAAVLAREHPATNRGVSLLVVPETHARPNPSTGPFFRAAATAMAGLAAVLLLIMSANVANLLMARAADRGRETALRAALGARRGRLVRQFLTESIVLALIGGVAAVPIVVLAVRSLRDFIARSVTLAPIDPDLSLDLRVFAATLGVAAAAGLVSGFAPALAASRTNVSSRLRAGGRGTSSAAGGFRGGLVIVQVALSLALLVSGGLFVRSLDRARDVDLGFDPDGLLVATAAPGLQGYNPAQRSAFYTHVSDRVAALPDVERAAWISMLPLGLTSDFRQVTPDEQPPDPSALPPTIRMAAISPGYFDTARVPLLEGRRFDDRDTTNSASVVIVNDALAKQFWPNRSAIGRRLTSNGVTAEVVGVVGNGKYNNVWETPQGVFFTAIAQDVPRTATIVVRTALAPAHVAAPLRQAIREVDPGVAVYEVKSMAEHLDTGSAFLLFRLGAFVTSVFGGMGIVLAAIGLYGMVACHVSLRTHEIGVRMALGAQGRDVLGDIMIRGARMATIGIAIGVLLAFAVARLLGNLLVGVSPFDPLTYGVVALFLIAICLLASFIPARRATTLSPISALRAE